MLRSALAAIAALGLAAPALAGTTFTANLEEPVAERTEIIANKAIWVCEGDTCTAELNRRTPSVRSCKQVAEEIGRLVAFISENGELDTADIDECNTRAKN